MRSSRRYSSARCTVGLLAGMVWWGAFGADEYVERISSFETDAEAFLFAYDAGAKGWAKVTDKQSSHGTKSLELKFAVTEAEAGMSGAARLFRGLARSVGIFRKRDDEGKLAGLGHAKDALPFDWTGMDALVFDAYNPSEAPLELTLKVESGLYEWDPTSKLYRTTVALPAKKWTPVSLSPKAMGEDFHPAGVLSVRMTVPVKGTLYVDDVRFVASVPPAPETKYIRLTWTRDPQTTQTITWQSRGETGVVRFGRKGEATDSTVSAKSIRNFAWGHGVLHEATLTGLKPDTNYEYQVRSSDGAWTPRRTFRTAPAADDAEFTFLAGSDTKGTRDVMIKLLGVFEDDTPRFMIYAGDALHTGGLASQWDRWFQAVEPFASCVPIMQSVGNHEVGGDPNLLNFLSYNALPSDSGSEAYYSFDYGPVHFVCLDTESRFYPEQVPWVEKDLSSTKKPWKVAYFHSPPFSSGTGHGSDEEARNALEPIFSKHHVNLVVSGDDHLYERSKPVNLAKSRKAPVSSYKEGTCYVVSGGAGAGLYDARPGNWWTAVLKTKVHHLCRVKVNGTKSMTLEAVDLKGVVFDRVALEN